MYEPKLEKLIEIAVRDGQITETERNVLLKTAAEFGVDPEELSMVVDARIVEVREQQQQKLEEKAEKEAKERAEIAEKERKLAEKEAETHAAKAREIAKLDTSKCLKCGETIHPLSGVCPACGTVRKISNKVIPTIQQLIGKIESVVEQLKVCASGTNVVSVVGRYASSEDKKELPAISELKAKYEKLVREANLYYGDDKKTKEILAEIHHNYLAVYKKAKKSSTTTTIVTCVIVAAIIITFVIKPEWLKSIIYWLEMLN